MTTFVTAFINIENVEEKAVSWRFEKFQDLVKTGINLCVYYDSTSENRINEIACENPNVKMMNRFSMEDLISFRICSEIDNLEMPHTDNANKDTKEYMMLINSKIEFIHETIEMNPFGTKYFAWIDFSISKVFSSEKYKNTLSELGKTEWDTKVLAIPGCHEKLRSNDDSIVRDELQSIYWRFCGGFFFGDSESLENFYNLYVEHFPKFVNKFKKIVWEVNFWAWLESNSLWSPNWYSADHNDSIIEIPYSFMAVSLNGVSNIRTYNYPSIENGLFVPSSASYIKYNGLNILNTRFVNYTIKDEIFICHDNDGILISKNVMSILDDNLVPTNYDIVDDPPKIRENLMRFNGIEDIRLYEKNNNIYFMGTSMSHTSSGNNSIVSGIYNYRDLKMEGCLSIDSPNNNWCEKNWTPVVIKDSTEFIVYKWSPMEVYRIMNNGETNSLEKLFTYNIKNDIFSKFRGSSIFTRIGDNLLGLVHFSEGEFLKRKYLHALVLIDGITMKPLQYSNNFYFSEEPGVEFCTGFAIIDMKYQFWISVRDGSPMNVSVNIETIPLCNKVLFI
jgi:hypothetical protein